MDHQGRGDERLQDPSPGLVVDDSVVARRVISDVLAAEDDLEVVGTAPNGRIALAKIPRLKPDLVTLDVEMPELNGIETLTEIRAAFPKVRGQTPALGVISGKPTTAWNRKPKFTSELLTRSLRLNPINTNLFAVLSSGVKN